MRAHGIHWAANPMAMSVSARLRRLNAIHDTNASAGIPSHQITRLPASYIAADVPAARPSW
jgi:hypothetical protein